MNSKLEINGTIKRNCPECGKEADCNCFVADGKSRLLCSECTFEEFGVGKPKRQKNLLADYELCKDCDGMTMRHYKDKTEVKDTHLVKHYECDKCGKTMKKRIKLRRQSK